MQDAPNIVILTGAGISAESGLATFRGPDGLWEGHRVENVCTPEALARDPATGHPFYDARRAALASVPPHAAHDALARLVVDWPDDVMIGTLHAADLHESAGAPRLTRTPGDLRAACSTAGANGRDL